MDLTDLKRFHDKAYVAGQVTRERASDDLVFYHITQWDDNLLEDTNLAYRGQFDILRKAGRQILGDLSANPIQVDFKPKDETREDGAELLDGLYRADDHRNESQEAYNYASQDAVVCGFGAWELYTEYATNRIGDVNQVIRRKWIPEAANTVYWDPNAKRLDKSDANYVSVLTAYSEEGYKDLVEDLTGTRPDIIGENFKSPEESFVFPWVGGESKKIYVTSFYHREKVKDKTLVFTDPVGTEMVLLESQLSDVMDEMLDSGFEIVAEKQIERWQVTKYIASGSEIISEDVIAGENIPVVPMYGERTIVEGEEHYEGITRLAKDPQRLRNFQMSYLADIVSKSPRRKPIFLQEQVAGLEQMYEEPGADNNYPYLIQHRVTKSGEPLPLGPVGEMPDQPIPQALAASMELTRQAVEDVANPGLPQDIADPDLSGKAVLALQNRMDTQSYIYQHNLKHAKRRDGEIYASIATEIYDAPRKVLIERPDGTKEQAEVMSAVVDSQSGEVKVLNDLTNMEFDVYSDIGHSFSSQKEATIDHLKEMAQQLAKTNPMLHEALILKAIELTDGVNTDDIRDYANRQLLLSGFREPKNEEEMQLVAQAQQSQQPDAATMLAMAEMEKAKADQMGEQRQAIKDQVDAQLEAQRIQIDQFRAETDRIGEQIDAQKVGADINYTNIKALDQQVETASKVYGARVNGL
jgi:hypothetical protein